MLHLRQYGIRLASTSAISGTTKPGKLLDSIIRVDHAGELGADRIYAGQMAVLGRTSVGPTIQHMWDQEKKHRAKFEELITKYRVRPTVLIPIWNVAGFILGAGTALMGEKAAMACTVAVETVITEHYNDQLRALVENKKKNENEKKIIIIIRLYAKLIFVKLKVKKKTKNNNNNNKEGEKSPSLMSV